jgi:small-conductance mechanosensitive channel
VDYAIFPREMLYWLAAVAIGFPVVMVVLGELILRLRRAGRPIATTLGYVRALVMPLVALYILLNHVLELPIDHKADDIVLTLLWIAVIYTALSFVDDVVFADAREGSWQSKVPRLFIELTRVVLILLGGAFVLSAVWKQPLGQFVAALGVGSLVLGLALQEPLGNIFAGVVLMFERPLNVGDWINVDGVTGRVVEINWRAVHLETATRERLIVPNSKLSKGNFSNFSRPSRLHTETVTLAFPSDVPPNKVKRILVETALATPGILDDPAPRASTSEYQDGKIAYKVSFTVAEFSALGPARDDFLSRLWYATRRRGLKLPSSNGSTPGRDPAELFAEFPSFHVNEPDALAELAPRISVEQFGQGEVVVAAGQRRPGLHLILAGTVSLAIRDRDGQPREVARAGRGEFFGESSVLSGEPSEVTVTALDDLEVFVLDSETLQSVLDRTPRLAREIGSVMDVRRKAAQAARVPVNSPN